LCLCLRVGLAMEETDVVGQCVMQMVDTDSLVDPVASMWNEVRVDRSCRRAIFPTRGSAVAADACTPGHCLQNELRVARSCRRAIFPTHGSAVAGDVCGLGHCLQKPDEVSMWSVVRVGRSADTDSLGDPVVSMWNEMRVDRSWRRVSGRRCGRVIHAAA